MAIYFSGMSEGELLALTDAMLRSGEVINLSDVPGLKIDKHSTGGIGDKVSLHLAPAVAACGVRVPMISGRGLGPHWRDSRQAGIDSRLLDETVGARVSHGAASRRSGADRPNRYAGSRRQGALCAARRDRHRRAHPPIAALITSKKLAEGIDGLVLDVKVGSGAFMKTRDEAYQLASTLVAIGRRAGKQATAFLTNMDQPLAVTSATLRRCWKRCKFSAAVVRRISSS